MPNSILDHSIEILIPKADKHGSPVEAGLVADIMAKEIGRAFGGARGWLERDLWVNRQGELIREKVIALKVSFGEDKLAQMASVVMTFALLGSGALNQAELAMEVDGKLVLVPADEWLVSSTTQLHQLAGGGNGAGGVQSQLLARRS